jgi:hypothetical protein
MIFKYYSQDEFGFSEVALKGEKNYFVEGYVSTVDRDKSGEILDEEAQEDLARQLENETITMDLEHESWYDDDGHILPKPKNTRVPVAKVVSVERKERGTWVKAMLNKNLTNFGEIWGSIRDGFLKAFSVAFYPVAKNNNVVSRLNLVNITLTGSPVNPNATFMATMKSASAYLDGVGKMNVTPFDTRAPIPEEKGWITSRGRHIYIDDKTGKPGTPPSNAEANKKVIGKVKEGIEGGKSNTEIAEDIHKEGSDTREYAERSGMNKRTTEKVVHGMRKENIHKIRDLGNYTMGRHESGKYGVIGHDQFESFDTEKEAGDYMEKRHFDDTKKFKQNIADKPKDEIAKFGDVREESENFSGIIDRAITQRRGDHLNEALEKDTFQAMHGRDPTAEESKKIFEPEKKPSGKKFFVDSISEEKANSPYQSTVMFKDHVFDDLHPNKYKSTEEFKSFMLKKCHR